MINAYEMMCILVEASPAFKSEWIEFQEEWKDEKKELPYYLVLGEYARHIKSLYESNQENLLKEIFHVFGKD